MMDNDVKAGKGLPRLHPNLARVQVEFGPPSPVSVTRDAFQPSHGSLRKSTDEQLEEAAKRLRKGAEPLMRGTLSSAVDFPTYSEATPTDPGQAKKHGRSTL